jgi:hypothetical protein
MYGLAMLRVACVVPADGSMAEPVDAEKSPAMRVAGGTVDRFDPELGEARGRGGTRRMSNARIRWMKFAAR